MPDHNQAEAISEALLHQSIAGQRAKTLAIQQAKARRPRKWTFLGLLCGLVFGPLLGFWFHHPWPAVIGLTVGTLLGRLADYQAARREHEPR
jgi:uncharacterized membrane protein